MSDWSCEKFLLIIETNKVIHEAFDHKSYDYRYVSSVCSTYIKAHSAQAKVYNPFEVYVRDGVTKELCSIYDLQICTWTEGWYWNDVSW